MSDKIRILLADDHIVVRRGLTLVLRQEPDFEVVAEAKDGAEVVHSLAACRPHIVLMDWKMPVMDGLSAAREVKRQMPFVRTLLLSGAPVESAVLDALDNGVDGFVHKDISPAGLAHAIRVVAGGKTYLGPEITQVLLQRSRQTPSPANQAPRRPFPPRARSIGVDGHPGHLPRNRGPVSHRRRNCTHPCQTNSCQVEPAKPHSGCDRGASLGTALL